MHKEYTARCNSVKQLNITVGFEKLKMALLEDLSFLDSNGKLAKDAYQKVCDVPGKKESTLMQLAWSVTEFTMLSKQANEFLNFISAMQLQILNGEQGNVQKSLLALKINLLEYLRGLYTKKRTPATDLLVFMVSDEMRNRKPYVVPIHFTPYESVTDRKMRELESEVECAMKNL